MRSATARNSLVIPRSAPQSPFSPLTGRCGPRRWGGVLGLSCVLRSAAHRPTSSHGRPLLRNQNIAPATLLLEFCASFDWNTLNTLLLEHCLSLEKAPVLSSSLSPTPPLIPAGQRQTCLPLCRREVSHRGAAALQVLQVNTASSQRDLATCPPG